MRNNNFVEFKNVSKSYSGFPALTNVSFNIGKGEIFGYIGPNGAGKTTTIKSLIGLISDFSGSINIAGKSMPEKRDEVHKILGYLPQDVSFQQWKTVNHALRSFGRLSGMDEDILEKRIDEVLKTVGISDSKNRKIKNLSGGNIQKVGLAQALLHKPKLLVFDEPLSGLDPASRHQVKEIIKELSKGETTVLFSSHILSDVQDIATKIGIINKGQLIDVGNLEELKKRMGIPNVIKVEFYEGISDPEDFTEFDYVESVEMKNKFVLHIHIDQNEDMPSVSKRLLKRLVEMDLSVKNYGLLSPDLNEMYIRYVGEGASS